MHFVPIFLPAQSLVSEAVVFMSVQVAGTHVGFVPL
jgi:hypothetical protein